MRWRLRPAFNSFLVRAAVKVAVILFQRFWRGGAQLLLGATVRLHSFPQGPSGGGAFFFFFFSV